VDIKEIQVENLSTSVSDTTTPEEPSDNAQVQTEKVQPIETTLRRSTREKRPAISNDYVVYSVEKECDLSVDKDPLSFKQGMNWDDSEKWYNATKEELKSLDNNKVWI